MRDDAQHAACVDNWLAQAAKGVPPEALLPLFEAALSALWARTTTTLGDVTVTAICDRVLCAAAEKFPAFSSLVVEPPAGVQCRGLRERIQSMDGSDLKQGIRFVLVEFLTVLGSLTAEILTPALHEDLSKVRLSEAVRTEKRAAGDPIAPAGSRGEDTKS